MVGLFTPLRERLHGRSSHPDGGVVGVGPFGSHAAATSTQLTSCQIKMKEFIIKTDTTTEAL